MTAQQGFDPAVAADVGMILRVPAFVVVTLALSLSAHVAAGGGLPTPGSAVLIGVLLGIVGRLFALHEQSLTRLVAMVWSVQAGSHFVMLAGHHHGGSHLATLHLSNCGPLHVTSASPLPAPGTTADLVAAADPAGQAASAVAAAAGEQSNPWLMFFLHAVAGLLVAAWLRRGEAVVFHAARRILPRLLRRRPALPVQPQRIRTLLPVYAHVRRPTARRYICLATPRRGPPLAAA